LNSAKQAGPGIHYGYVVLAMSALGLMGAFAFGRLAYTLILPSMREALDLSYSESGTIATSALIGYTLSVPISGALASKYGSRRVASLTMLLVGITMILTGLSNGFLMAAALQLVSGIAGGGVITSSMGVLSSWFAPAKRGLAMGAMGSGAATGFFLTGASIPAIVASDPLQGWRYSWFAFGLLVILLGLVIYAFLRDRPEEKGLDPIGQGPSPATQPASPEPRPALASVYRSRALWRLGAIYGIFGFVYVNYATFFAAYLQQEGGLAPGLVGNLWMVSGMGVIIGSILWGIASDRVGRRWSLAATLLGLGISVFFLTVGHTPAFYYLSALLFWLMEPGVPVIAGAAAGDYVGGRLASAAVGFISIFLGLGQALGPSLGGFIADVTHSFNIAFYLAALVAMVGALAAMTLRQPTARL
jgi:sugar phosphate permease